MKRLFACLVGLAALGLAGCAAESDTAAVEVTEASKAPRLGAGDSLGQSLFQSDRAIGQAESRDRTLVSHPDE